jgi:hypothetical protein
MATPTEPSRLPSAAALVALTPERERVIAELTDAFARERIELDVFEHRLTLAHRAGTVEELQRLVVDLDPALTSRVPATPPPAIVALDGPSDPETMLALCGGLQRHGTWNPPRHLRVVALMGGVELDFREAQLWPGLTEVNAFAAWGGIHIVVPPHLPVEVSGMAILGGFDHGRRLPAPRTITDPLAPRLRISGLAIMGGVSVETRLAGETHRDARRRRRRERRALRRGAAPCALLGDGDH